MITIKNSYIEILANNQGILVPLKRKNFPMKIGYWINKGLSKAFNEIEHYMPEKEKLIQKYSIKDDDGKTIENENGTVNLSNVPEFTKEINELLKISIELEGVYEIEIDLEDPSLPKLTLEEQALIEPFIKIKDKDSEK